MDLRDFLTTAQVARRLGVSQELVRVWARQGRLPYVPTPHGRLYPAAEVERLAAERQRGGGERDAVSTPAHHDVQ
ncbi:MAG: helix-turn-helix domain-containing protein [Thermomicrobium sp.]|nr:helix-turn-helix domain-containing protein [Thermomicrobium sp.]MDW8007390.1 helix-turn-helix domain-containing protein [Thermomicrobium sp.]